MTSIYTLTKASSTLPTRTVFRSTITSNLDPALGHGGTTPLAALTTIFTPPPECWNGPTFDLRSQPCYPPKISNIDTQKNRYYSPAICPSGFTVACNLPDEWNPEFWHGPKLEAGETARSCCPMSYTCDVIDPFFISNRVSKFCVSTRKGGAQPLSATAVQIRWKESDVTNLETHPLTPGLRPTAIPRGAGKAGGSEGGQESASAGGLATGAIIGLVVAGVVGLIIVLFALWFFLKHKRKEKAARPGNPAIQNVENIELNGPSDLPEVANHPPPQYVQKQASMQEQFRPPSAHSYLAEAPGAPVQQWSTMDTRPWNGPGPQTQTGAGRYQSPGPDVLELPGNLNHAEMPGFHHQSPVQVPQTRVYQSAAFGQNSQNPVYAPWRP